MSWLDWFKTRGGAPTLNAEARASIALTGAPRARGMIGGRPGWWREAGPQNGILYPDDALNALLEELRRTVPIVDRGVGVLVQLCGGVEVEASSGVRAELSEWLARVRVNQQQRGFQSWLEGHLDGMLMYGKGVGEMVPTRGRTDLHALTNLDPRSILFKVTDDPLALEVLQRQRHQAAPVRLNPATMAISLNGGHVDRPHGVSIFRSIPFVAKAARTIENATAQVWERMGAPPFHINWEPDESFPDPQGTLAGEVLADLKRSWDRVMTARDPEAGGITDMLTSGKVTIRVMGAEGTPLSITEPFRAFAEQMVCLTGLPAWLLGMHWSSTERLAAQQAELIVTQIEAIRRSVMPQVEQIVETRQRLAGKSGRYKLKWTPITLHDRTEQARARAWEAQAAQREIANAVRLWHLGLINQQQAARRIDPSLTAVDRPLSVPPLLPEAGTVVVSPSE
jgi:hypothetical protein